MSLIRCSQIKHVPFVVVCTTRLLEFRNSSTRRAFSISWKTKSTALNTTINFALVSPLVNDDKCSSQLLVVILTPQCLIYVLESFVSLRICFSLMIIIYNVVRYEFSCTLLNWFFVELLGTFDKFGKISRAHYLDVLIIVKCETSTWRRLNGFQQPLLLLHYSRLCRSI